MSQIHTQYTPVDQLELLMRGGKRRANVYGVVKFIAFKGRGHGTSHISIISLHNSELYTLRRKFVITIFDDQNSDLPRPDVGDIMRFDNLQLDAYQGTCNGKCVRAYGSHWYIFDGSSTDYNIKSTSSHKPQIDKIIEIPIIDSLRQWITQTNPTDDYPPSPDKASDSTNPTRTSMALNSNQPSTSNDSTAGVFKTPNPIITGNTSLHTRLSNMPVHSAQNLSKLKLREVSQLNVVLLSVYKCQSEEEIKLLLLKIADGYKPSLRLNLPVLDNAHLHSTHPCNIPPSYVGFIIVYGEDNINRALQLIPGESYNISHVRPMIYSSVGAPELYVHDRYNCSYTPLSTSDHEAISQRLDQIAPGWNNSSNNNKNNNHVSSRTTFTCEQSMRSKKDETAPEVANLAENDQERMTSTSTRDASGESMRNFMTDLYKPPRKRTRIGEDGLTRVLIANVPELTLRELESLQTGKNRASLYQINVYITDIQLIRIISVLDTRSEVSLCLTCKDDSQDSTVTLDCAQDDLREFCGVYDEAALLEPGMQEYLRLPDLKNSRQPIKLLVTTINDKHYITHTEIIAPI